MRLTYQCRHCGNQVASIDVPEVDEARLGLAALTPEERADILAVRSNGNEVVIQAVCDDCCELPPEPRVH